MGINEIIARSPLANYGKSIREAPREVIFNRKLILSSIIYAFAAIPATWDQGSASVIPSLPGFQKHFKISSGANADQIKNIVSLVYIGYTVGSALSFFLNDRVGRLWSYRLYIFVWFIGQIVAISAPGLPGLYAARIISGLGIGALTVAGPMSIVELAPMEIRGLLCAWFPSAMGIAFTSAIFCVYGVFLNVPHSRLQYQIVYAAPCIFMALCIVSSFFISESPRWLLLRDRRDEAIQTLIQLRGLPEDHPRVQMEIKDMEISISNSRADYPDDSNFVGILKETFTVPSNLRRVQQSLVSYALAQMSGANSITNYFVPILTIIGTGGGTTRNLFLTGMYGIAKLSFSLIASFFLIDALGRRKSLFIGITFQMLSDIYIGIYIKHKQYGTVNKASSEAAIGLIFIHGFGYMIGLFILPYVFGAELWPNRIRSFGGALGQSFHWLFIYIMTYATPSILKKTHNWGAFIFFAGWCFISLIYVYLMVPEIAGLSGEEIEDLFRGSWFNAYKRSKKPQLIGRAADEEDKQSWEDLNKNISISETQVPASKI